MTSKMNWLAIIAACATLIVIPLYAWFEPSRQETTLLEFRTNAVLSGTELYAENCAVCHGASGQGIAGNPPLQVEALRETPADDLYRVISDGRYNTQMAAWSLENGGLFTSQQIDDLVTLVQYANWDYVAARVAELGLTPPEVIELEVTDEMLATIQTLPGGQTLASGITIYAQNCAACHNANAAGTLIAPALDTAELRATSYAELTETVSEGVPGTLMAGWEQSLSPQEIEAVLELVLRWPEIVNAGIQFPETEMTEIPSSPERIAEGAALFQVACKSCHGVDAFGSPMAPALNNTLFLNQTPDAAIYQIIAGGVPGTLMPAWGSRLTDYDLQTLVAYLRSFEPTAPPVVPPIVN